MSRLLRTIRQESVQCNGLRFSIEQDHQEIGRAYLYIMKNDLHPKPFGLLEDLFVAEGHRGQGIGKQLINQVTEEARKKGCYKLIATSRHSRERIHQLYQHLGFKNHGLEFRQDF